MKGQETSVWVPEPNSGYSCDAKWFLPYDAPSAQRSKTQSLALRFERVLEAVTPALNT
jgi:hypothetical protein